MEKIIESLSMTNIHHKHHEKGRHKSMDLRGGILDKEVNEKKCKELIGQLIKHNKEANANIQTDPVDTFSNGAQNKKLIQHYGAEQYLFSLSLDEYEEHEKKPITKKNFQPFQCTQNNYLISNFNNKPGVISSKGYHNLFTD